MPHLPRLIATPGERVSRRIPGQLMVPVFYTTPRASPSDTGQDARHARGGGAVGRGPSTPRRDRWDAPSACGDLHDRLESFTGGGEEFLPIYVHCHVSRSTALRLHGALSCGLMTSLGHRRRGLRGAAMGNGERPVRTVECARIQRNDGVHLWTCAHEIVAGSDRQDTRRGQAMSATR